MSSPSAAGGVTQRMRWIPPGLFRMGSPDDEPGRYDAEGPQHQVLISRGYWLFETPVTQALWLEVMGGDNPSRFQTPDQPVEQISWHDASRFIETINAQVPGLGLSLPTEAQWEYACRAGTATATYAVPIEILGQNSAPSLDGIAWYGGNSGIGFDLDKGWDAGWGEKQYEFDKAGTHPVWQREPNPWGLYDTLGNVWEWCLDDRRGYAGAGAPLPDPVGPLDGPGRVYRGG